MNYGLRLAAFCERVSQFLLHQWAIFRVRVLLPALLWRGRNMLLLTNGIWVDASPDVRSDSVQWAYNAVEHRLIRMGVDNTRFQRWKWLAATSDCGRDMSDFFSDLRIARAGGGNLPDTKVIELFIHQKGWIPGRVLRVVDRATAEEEEVFLDGRPVAAPVPVAAPAPVLDYIR